MPIPRQARHAGTGGVRAGAIVAVLAVCLTLAVANPSDARGPAGHSQGADHSQAADHSQGAANRSDRASAALAENGLAGPTTTCDVLEVVFETPHPIANADAMAGCYIEDGTQNGKTLYRDADGEGHSIFWWSGSGSGIWFMHSASSSNFFNAPVDTATPPTDGWGGKGGAPFPTIIYG